MAGAEPGINSPWPTVRRQPTDVRGSAFRESGMVVRENFGAIESFEKTPGGVRMIFS